MSTTLPPLFVSHGSPMIALEPGEAGAFMQRLGPAISATFGRPKAIVSISAHTAARVPVVVAGARHSAIYDFGGFDPKLFTLRYDAPGDPALAARVLALLRSAGIGAESVDQGGLDHGAWTALRFLYPEADIPIVPLAFVPSDSPARQFALGAALAPLTQEGVLVLGSGSITHNLRRVFSGGGLHPDKIQPEIPSRRRSAAGSPTARARSTGTRSSPTARARRTASTCTRPTSTCCPGTSPPVPAAARRRRCACTTARPWAASAWTRTRSDRRRARSPMR